jgi:hypothetical protein
MKVESSPIKQMLFVKPNGGWYIVQCSCCLQKKNTGRPGNGAGLRWARQEALDWFKEHDCKPLNQTI